MGSPQGYRASWWTFLLHQAPHINFQFEPVGSEFAPEDWGYQQVSECPLWGGHLTRKPTGLGLNPQRWMLSAISYLWVLYATSLPPFFLFLSLPLSLTPLSVWCH
uniref:Uncharacterized protein n=1 Tax=Anolis carolinensis TaxID=28377 RepID=A0A803TJK4_ANOCA